MAEFDAVVIGILSCDAIFRPGKKGSIPSTAIPLAGLDEGTARILLLLSMLLGAKRVQRPLRTRCEWMMVGDEVDALERFRSSDARCPRASEVAQVFQGEIGASRLEKLNALLASAGWEVYAHFDDEQNLMMRRVRYLGLMSKHAT